MPRNPIDKEELKIYLDKLKHQLWDEDVKYSPDPKGLANKYLNKVIDKINEYRY